MRYTESLRSVDHLRRPVMHVEPGVLFVRFEQWAVLVVAENPQLLLVVWWTHSKSSASG